MQDLTAVTITSAVLEQMASTPEPRLREVAASLVRHLHSFARDVRLTPAEWLQAITFLTQTGQTCTPARQEFILLSDVLGLSALVNLMHDAGASEPATESSLLGPFYQQQPPAFGLGQSIAVHAAGPELLVYGGVVDGAGQPVPHARIQVWQTDSQGAYDLQTHGGGQMDMRGQFSADGHGQFHFRTLMPHGYYIPMDGPVGALIRAQARHGCRPAHIHFLVDAPGYRELVTALFISGDPYIDSDTVFGVSSALVVTPRLDDSDAPLPGMPAVRYQFRLAAAGAGETGRVAADPAQIMAAPV